MLITHGADYVIGHSLEDGKELWRCGGFNVHGDSYNPTLRLGSSPVCGEGIIVVPTLSRDTGSLKRELPMSRVLLSPLDMFTSPAKRET